MPDIATAKWFKDLKRPKNDFTGYFTVQIAGVIIDTEIAKHWLHECQVFYIFWLSTINQSQNLSNVLR